MLGRRAQHDSLIGRLCEDEGYGQRMLRKAYGWPPKGPWWTCRCSEPPFGRSSCPRPVAVLPLSRLRSPLDQSQDGHPDGVAWPSEDFSNLSRICACVGAFHSEHHNANYCTRVA
jgi:hypothetical protein